MGIKEAIGGRVEAVEFATHAARRKAAVMVEALELKLTHVVDASTTSHHGWYGGRTAHISQMSNSFAGGQAEGGGSPGLCR